MRHMHQMHRRLSDGCDHPLVRRCQSLHQLSDHRASNGHRSSFHSDIGDWLFGCDICQEVCPHNQPTTLTSSTPTHEAYAARTAGRDQSGASFDVREVLDWTEEDRRLAFTTSSMKRAKLDMIERNAIIVAGNYLREHEDVDLSRRLNEIACDEAEPSLVRQAAIEIVGSHEACLRSLLRI